MRVPATAHYHRTHHDPDPTLPGTLRLPNLTPLDATNLTRIHLRAYPTLRSIRAEPHGEITLLQGNRHIRLEPGTDAHPSHLTDRQAEDLLLICGVGDRAHIVATGRGPAIDAGLHRIPPAASELLARHGWIATAGASGDPVAVSLAGTVALAWRSCKAAGVPSGEWAVEIAESVYGVYAPCPA